MPAHLTGPLSSLALVHPQDGKAITAHLEGLSEEAGLALKKAIEQAGKGPVSVDGQSFEITWVTLAACPEPCSPARSPGCVLIRTPSIVPAVPRWSPSSTRRRS